MVQHCIVNTCTTTFRSRGRDCQPVGVKLHRFPSGPGRLASWINNIRFVNGPRWEPTHLQSARVCSLHFAPDAYELERQDGVIKLKWNAVPTVFLKPKSGVAPTDHTTTSDHLYSTAREEASRKRQEQINSRRKVLKSINNAPIPDHVYAAPEPDPSETLPTHTVDEQSSLEDHMVRLPTLRVEETDDDMVRFPTLQVEETEDYMVRFPPRRVKATKNCELIDLDEDSSEEAPAAEVQGVPQNAMKMSVVNGNVVLALPDGLALARLVGLETPPERTQARSCLTDSEVDKLQIKRLTDENRKLQEELNKVRRYAEKLLTQNARLRQQNRVTSRAYRDMKNLIERANENLNNPFSDDESIREERCRESDEEAVVSGTKCGSAVHKDLTKRPPYASVLKALKQKNGAGNSKDLFKLLTQCIPKESPQNDSTPSECSATNEVFNAS